MHKGVVGTVDSGNKMGGLCFLYHGVMLLGGGCTSRGVLCRRRRAAAGKQDLGIVRNANLTMMHENIDGDASERRSSVASGESGLQDGCGWGVAATKAAAAAAVVLTTLTVSNLAPAYAVPEEAVPAPVAVPVHAVHYVNAADAAGDDGGSGGGSGSSIGMEAVAPMRTTTHRLLRGPHLNARWEQRSERSQVETFVLVSNATGRTLDLGWIDYSGEERQYATIEAGETVIQPTYATHRWTVRDHDNDAVLLVLEARRETAVAVIGLGEDNPVAEEHARAIVRDVAHTYQNRLHK